MSTPFEPVEVMTPVRWRIPPEVVEKIINTEPVGYHRYSQGPDDRYQTLCAFALSCRALVPTSRICLFREVKLTSGGRASKFLATISDAPAFGKLVHVLCIDCGRDQGESGWVYDALKVLPTHLTKLYELQYFHLPVLHSLFHVLSPRFSTVRSLFIESYKQTFRETIQIINGFKNLERLTFSCGQSTLGHFFLKRSHRLKYLDIHHEIFVWKQAHNLSNWTIANNSTLQLTDLHFPLYRDIKVEPAIRNCSQSLKTLTLHIARLRYTSSSQDIYHCPQLNDFQYLTSISLFFIETLSGNDSWIHLISTLSIDNLPSSLQNLHFLLPAHNSTEIFSEVGDWGNLDTTLTNSKFSNLRSVEIIWHLQGRASMVWEENVLKNMVQTRLERLNEEKFYQNYFPKLYKNILVCKHYNGTTFITFFPK